jgi:hypothetical protein
VRRLAPALTRLLKPGNFKTNHRPTTAIIQRLDAFSRSEGATRGAAFVQAAMQVRDVRQVRRSLHWNFGRREPLIDGMKVEATVPIILWLLGVPLVVVVVLMLAHVI